MTVKPIDHQESRETPPGTRPHELYAALLSLARQSRTSDAYYKAALGRIASLFPCPYAVLYLRRASAILEEYWHNGPASPEFWAPAMREFVNHSLAQNEPGLKLYHEKSHGGRAIVFLSCPIQGDESASGTIALIVACGDRQQALRHLVALESATAALTGLTPLINASGQPGSNDQTLHTLARAGGYGSSQELAFAITNNLRNRIGCEQVALGIVRGARVRIVSISGQDSVKKGSRETSRIQEAMSECLDFDAPCQYHLNLSQSDDTLTTDLRLHRQWHEATGNAAVASIPLADAEGECQAILSVRRSSNQPFAATELQKIRETTEPLIGAFKLVDRANRSLLAHLGGTLSTQARGLRCRRSLLKTLAATALIALAGWLVLAQRPYRIAAPARIQAAHLRHFAAPAEARLDEVLVTRGDRVRAGDILCRFGDESLQLERSELLAEYQIARLQENKAIANQSSTDIELARANRDYLKARLDLLDSRLARLTVTAPCDGLIVQGDLTRQIGQILSLGAPLFELTPLGQWEVELQVPESKADDIATGMTGQFAAHARPDMPLELTVHQVAPAAELAGGHNVFIVRTVTSDPPVWIKSGMEGIARIEAGRRPVWWLALHQFRDYLYLHFWY